MSGFGTKKPGGDVALQMTFPAVFSATARADRMPFAYYPDPAARPPVLEMSKDLQGYYHEQKKAEAHRMAMAAVHSRKASDYRAQHSHAGYYGMPRPVLSQRIYANPSNGNQADIYPARRIAWEDQKIMRGGVLYTAQAQRWGRNKLRERIGQLSAIDVAKQGFQTGEALGALPTPVGVEVPEGALPESVSTKAKIELVAILQQILASVDNSVVNALSFGDVVKFLRLLFRWAASADDEELKEMMEYIDYIEQGLLGIEAQAEEGEDADYEFRLQNAYVKETLEVMRKVREYLRRMISVSDKTPAERKAASAAFVKALGFTKLSLRSEKNATAEQIRKEAKDEERAAAIAQSRETGLPPSAYYEDDDAYFPETQSRYVIGAEPVEMQREYGRRHRDAAILEQMAARQRRARFDPQVRDEMGARNGAYEGEDLPEGAAVGIRNPFRQGDGEDAGIQLEVAERLPAAPRFRLAAAEEEAAAPEEVAAAAAVAPAIRPDWLTREMVDDGDQQDLYAIVARLRREGYRRYKPYSDSKRKTLRNGLLKAYNL